MSNLKFAIPSGSSRVVETPVAEDVEIADAGNYFEGENVEAALQEVGEALDGVVELLMEI